MSHHLNKDPAAHYFNADCRPGVDYMNTCFVCGGPKEGHKTDKADELYEDYQPRKKRGQ